MEQIEYDIFDENFQMKETCLADKVWNLLWRENGFSTKWITLYFTEDEDEVWGAINQLIDEERAYLTPKGQRLNPLWTFSNRKN